MELKDILMWMVGIFIAVPWWMKLIMIIIILGIFQFIGEMISKPFEVISKNKKLRTYEKTGDQISAVIDTDPQRAFQMIVENRKAGKIGELDYEAFLTKIAEATGNIEAMMKLTALHLGKGDKYYYWLERAAKAGHLESITEYFGFSDYDVSSDKYEEMMQALDRVQEGFDHEKEEAAYLKGLVYYKQGDIDTAKQIFASIILEKEDKRRKYMLFRCAVQESDSVQAEKLLAELELDGFKISAAEYLNLYNFYTSIQDVSERNYEKELRYAEKYAAGKDADHETANEIMGKSYYCLAVALEKGTHGFETDKEKAFKTYEKAASFENPEALYYLGKRYWSGTTVRNYEKANEYFIRSANKGYAQAKSFLEKYGVGGILVSSAQQEKITYQFLDNYALTASSNTMQWLQIYYGMQYKGKLLASAFEGMYAKSFGSFDQMVNGVHQLYTDSVAQMLQWSIQLLMRFDIDEYCAEDLIEICRDLSLLPRVPLFEQELERIDDRARELNAQTYYAKASRGTWSGAGFGTTLSGTIGATVKASIAAEAMNIGSSVLHGVGDSIVKSMDNKELNKMKKNLFENQQTKREFRNAVFMACLDILEVVMGIIEDRCGFGLRLEGSVMFEKENLSELTDRVLYAKITNNLSIEKYEYANALLVEALRRQPLDADLFRQIVNLMVQSGGVDNEIVCRSCIRYAGDFQLPIDEFVSIFETVEFGDEM